MFCRASRAHYSTAPGTGTVPVMRLSTYIDAYQNHPEAKAADRFGNPAGPETTLLLYRLRLRSKRLQRIGKEVDRLDQEEGASLDPVAPSNTSATI